MKKTSIAFLLVIVLILSLSMTAAFAEIPLSASMYNISTGIYHANYYIQFTMGAAGGFPPYQYKVEMTINGALSYSNIFTAGGVQRINRFSMPDGTYRIDLTVTDSHAQTALAHTTAVISGGVIQYIAEDTQPVLYTGWSQESGYWYYYKNSVRQTGWQKIGSNWYYLGTYGAMVTGNQVIGGVQFTFSGNGILLKKALTLAPSSFILDNGAARLLSPVIIPADVSTPALTWTSSNEAIAVVSASGLIQSVSPGSAIITATATDGSTTAATSLVTVVQKVTGITLTPNSLTLLLGTAQQITASVLPANASNPALIWSSSDNRIATVSPVGLVTAVGRGFATITVKAADSGGFTAALGVTITVPDGWLKEEAGWAYYISNARVTGWYQDGSTWYYMNSNGYMQTGWVSAGSEKYYLNASGAMQTGWLNQAGSWYHLSASGAMQKGWFKEGSTWYYLAPNGVMKTGWVSSGGTWYYLSSSGAMHTGWIKDGGSWYYLNASGAMKTGWLEQGSTWYYLKGNGVMATGPLTIDGQVSLFSSNGYWLGYQ